MKSFIISMLLMGLAQSAQAKVEDFGSLIEESAKSEKALKTTLQKQLNTKEAGVIKKDSFKATGEAFIGDNQASEHVAVESTGEFRAKGKSAKALDYEHNNFKRLADEIKDSK